jgi:endosialidase-like protein
MKTTTNNMYPAFALFVLVCLALSPATDAQCPQICDSNQNTAVGDSALISNTGTNNTAIGFSALFNNTTGDINTANGSYALSSNTTGSGNTAMGSYALHLNNIGAFNVATGGSALFYNSTGSDNTATGIDALFSNSTGGNSTTTGFFALPSNTTGLNNTATGAQALYWNTTGNNNSAIGWDALYNTTGGNNIAVGSSAGGNLTTGSYNIDIGSYGLAGESQTIRIGKRGTQTTTIIAGIRDTTVTGGVAVMIDANGRLGTITSSARFKEGIKPMDKASEAIFALKPVTFRYKHELDPTGTPQLGLVAEQVAKVNPALVARDAEGKPCAVRYEEVNAMLLNEFLKEHNAFVEEQRKVQELEANAVRQQKQIEALTAELKEQSAFIQAVNDKVELTNPAPQTVLSNQ